MRSTHGNVSSAIKTATKAGLKGLVKAGLKGFKGMVKAAINLVKKAWNKITGKGLRKAPIKPPSRTPRREPNGLADTASKPGNKLTRRDIDVEFDAVDRGRRRPSTVPGYVDEVELPNGHTWRRDPAGNWCRFSNNPSLYVRMGDVVPYEESVYKKGSRVARGRLGDLLAGDHIPSAASLIKAEENKLGRKLTKAEKRKLRDKAVTVVLDHDTHERLSRTYLRKNSPAQVAADAKDLAEAFALDAETILSGLAKEGRLTPSIVRSYYRAYTENVARGIFKPKQEKLGDAQQVCT